MKRNDSEYGTHIDLTIDDLQRILRQAENARDNNRSAYYEYWVSNREYTPLTMATYIRIDPVS